MKKALMIVILSIIGVFITFIICFSIWMSISSKNELKAEKKAKQEEFNNLPKHIKDSLNTVKEFEIAKAEIEKVIKNQFMPRSGEHIMLSKFVKRNMKNPKSYEHIGTVYEEFDGYLIVKTSYRGTNSFGGIVPNTTTAKVNISTGDIIEIIE